MSTSIVVRIPIAGHREDLNNSTATVITTVGNDIPVSRIREIMWHDSTPDIYIVCPHDGLPFYCQVDTLLEAGVIRPGDPGTPEWNPPEATKDDPWDSIREKPWQEFRETGLLRFVNVFLHIFGWAIVLDMEDGKVTRAYPARVPFRGFPEESMTEGYRQIARFMEENASEIRKEAEID